MRRQRTEVERLVDPLDPPDVALHGAEHRRAVGEEVVVAEEEQGLPGVIERRLDRVDGVRRRVAPGAPCRRAPAATGLVPLASCLPADARPPGPRCRWNLPPSTQGASSISISPIR